MGEKLRLLMADGIKSWGFQNTLSEDVAKAAVEHLIDVACRIKPLMFAGKFYVDLDYLKELFRQEAP